MTKRDLVVKIAKETDLIQNDVAQVVQKTLDYIAAEVGVNFAWLSAENVTENR